MELEKLQFLKPGEIRTGETPVIRAVESSDRFRQRHLPRRLCVLIPLLLLATLAQAAQPDLRLVKSKYYLIHSDLDDDMVFDLGTRMDAMYAEYSRRLSDFALREDKEPLNVYLFQRSADYTDFTGNRYTHTGGVFVAGKNQLAAYLEGRRDTLRRTLQHEAFHQFAFKAMGDNMPIWLNEGMAQLFEEAIWTGETFLMNQVPPRRIRQLQSDLHENRLLSFRALTGLSSPQWNANLAKDADLGGTQYNQAWAIVHYMAYGDGGKNGARLVALLKGLSAGRKFEDAFRESFAVDMETFRARFEDYALALAPTVEATLIDRHEVLAELCAHLAEKGQRFASVAEYRAAVEVQKYQLLYTRGQVTWKVSPAPFFRDDAGVAYSANQLYFEPRKSAALPDLVFHHPAYRIGLRARFYKTEKRTEYDVLVEPPNASSTANIER
jgi:Peptidase MA superfamily